MAVMFWNGDSWAWWQMLLMRIGMLGFWALVAWGIWARVIASTRRPDTDCRDRSARQILDERFARREIDIDEYRQRREAIASSGERTPVDVGNGTGR